MGKKPSFDVVIKLISSVEIVPILSPCNSTSKVVNFLESSNRFKWELSPIFSQCVSNIITSFLVLVVVDGRPYF